MSTFCRHNRFVTQCPICRPAAEPARPPARAGGGSTTRRSSASAGGGTARRGAGGVRVRRLTRAVEDGYASPLVPGLRASADARRLADELAAASGRLDELAIDPPEPYASAAAEPGREEALWQVVQIALLGTDAPRVRWAAGDVPDLDGVTLGGRAPFPDAASAQRALAAYRAWSQRAGSQDAALTGDAGWTAPRRFERVFERLGTLPGVARGARYDLLVVLGRLGLLELDAPALLPDARDDASQGAKRVFGIGDRFVIERRAAELVEAAGAPIAALDLALANFARSPAQEPLRLGASEDAVDPQVRERALSALRVDDREDEDEDV